MRWAVGSTVLFPHRGALDNDALRVRTYLLCVGVGVWEGGGGGRGFGYVSALVAFFRVTRACTYTPAFKSRKKRGNSADRRSRTLSDSRNAL